MDPLSGAASVIAVVSLVVQVSDSIKKLNDFRLSVKNAPQDIVQLSDQLVVLEDILKAISRKIQASNGLQNLEIDATHPLYGAMRICQSIALELKQVVEYIETRYKRRGAQNLRTSVIAGWRKGRIKELKDRLDFACQVLLLQGTLGCSSWQVEKVSVAISNGVEETCRQVLAESRTERSLLPHTASLVTVPSAKSSREHQDLTIFSPPPNNALRSTLRSHRKILGERIWTSRFGVLRIRTYSDQYELSPGSTATVSATYCLKETEFRFTPSWSSSGFLLSTLCPKNKWIPASVRSSFIIPDTSKIFEICRDRRCDNTTEVLKEFSEGRASPFDTNSLGETLLHAAAFACNPVLCKALLKAGANPSALDCLGKSPLEHASRGFPDYSNQVLTCRVLEVEGQMDPWDLLVTESSDSALNWCWLSYLGGDLCHWILSHDKPWFNVHGRESGGGTLLDIVFQLWVLEMTSRPVDQSEWVGPLKWLIRAGGDIHLRCSREGNYRCSSLVWMMFYSSSFEDLTRRWFDVLRDCGVDVTEYIEEEKRICGDAVFYAVHRGSHPDGFGACLVLPSNPIDDHFVTMKYVLPPTLDYEALPLFAVFKDILSYSETEFNHLLNNTSFVYRSPFFKELDKESIRVRRERTGKPVSMTRRRRKLVACFHSSLTPHWSRVRSAAKRALVAEYARYFDQAEVAPPGHEPGKIVSEKGLQTAFSDHFLKSRSPYVWGFTLVLAVSFGVNVLLFQFWMSSS